MSFSLIAWNKERRTAARRIAVTQAGQLTNCTGPCKFVFPQPDASEFASVAMDSVAQAVTCPDPGLCDASASQQLDDVNVTMCAGSSAVSDAGSEVDNFSLALSDATQATMDSVTFDPDVPAAFGNYGAVAPDQCVTGDIYFDAVLGSQWTSLNFAYTSASFSIQLVYVWHA